MISIDTLEKIAKLGQRVRQFRLKNNEVQERFAARLGVSIPTLRKIEKGDETVSMGTWMEILNLFGRLSDMDRLLENNKSLFEVRDEITVTSRRRASKRTY